MPIQTLKIDRSFIANVPNREDDMKLVRSIVSMSHDLELDVVAEGVETQAQLAFLRAIGCGRVQGYVSSPPLGAAEFESFAKLHDNGRGASGTVAL